MNDILPQILEIAKYTIPAMVVLWATNNVVKRFTLMETERKQLAILKESQDITIRLRLQAYERLTLLIERIQPRNLMPRAYTPGLTVAEFQHVLTESINAEYEHNLAQQVYVSRQVWKTIMGVKEQEINMINQIAKQLAPDADARDLHKRIVDFIMSSDEELPTQMALDIIHDEARKVLSFASLNS